ncbi:MAG: hypothetical protein RIQ53_3428 [Pseudomonadota bacterium]|jgi:hypothetical protein
MSALTLVTHVYNDQANVDTHVAHWKSFPPALRRHLSFLVIDDHSDEPLRIDAGELDLRLVRVSDDIDWNMPGCRNLGALLSRTEWMLYFDADNITSADNIARLVQALPTLDASRLYVFRRTQDGRDVDPHINTYLITRSGFWQAGGYDEDFSGHYGYEDVVFRAMWRQHCGGETLLSDIAFEQMHWRTQGLDRDTTRNQALAQYKLAIGLPKPQGFVRFRWEAVAVAAASAPPAAGPERSAAAVATA